MSAAAAHPRGVLPVASLRDTARLAGTVVLPIVAQGVVARRPRVVAVAGRLGTDDRAVRLLQHMRDRYGPGPLRLRIPGRSAAVLLSADHVQRVLDESPDPFATANREKRGALGHFQPHGVLISHGSSRAERRRFNEAVLDTGRPLHRQAEAITRTVREEARLLREAVDRTGELTWPGFITAWWRAVRRVVLGDEARDDHELTDMLTALRSAANWSGLRPRRRALLARFEMRLRAHLDRAEPGSLAARIAATPTAPETDPTGQVPQWLFAFDPAGAVAIRALALLATHPEQAAQVRAETDGLDLDAPQDLARLRAAVLESVRLWPTTPLILRDTTTETHWNGGALPPGTAVVIATWFFHRDDGTLPEADRFDPQLWLSDRARAGCSPVPFSAGPATCPGRELVLFTTSTFLAALLEERRYSLRSQPALRPGRPLPRALDPYSVRFTVDGQRPNET